MKVERGKAHQKTFSDLKDGDVFEDGDGYVMMKLAGEKAAMLSDGGVFEDDVIAEPCTLYPNAKVVLEP